MKASAKVTKLPAVNPSGITPMEYKVVVLPKQELGYVELKGGFKLHKPDETKERDQHAASQGVVVAVSPTAFTFEVGAPKAEPGQTVLFARYSGMTHKGKDGVEYRIMNDKDIVAVME